MRELFAILLLSLGFGGTQATAAQATRPTSGENVRPYDVVGSEIFIDGNKFAQMDIGRAINAAYSACPTAAFPGYSACRIVVAEKPDGGCYETRTPIKFVSLGKPVEIDFGGACVKFEGRSGAAITMDPGRGSPSGYLWKISDLKLLGPCTSTACRGVTTTGIDIGLKNGAAGGELENVEIGSFDGNNGFAVGLADRANISYLYVCDGCRILGNRVGVDSSATENATFLVSEISNNATGVIASSADLHFIATSFDSNTTIAVTSEFGVISFDGCHFENLGQGPANYLSAAGTAVTFEGGGFMDDVPTGVNPQMISISDGAQLSVFGTEVWSCGRTTTNLISATGDITTAFLDFSYAGSSQPGTRIKNEITPGTLIGRLRSMPLQSPGGSSLPEILPNLVLDPSLVSQLPPASGMPGMMMQVSDSTVILHEGQDCVGSGTVRALAMSDGTHWKCF